MEKYKPVKEDIYYEDESVLIYVKGQEVLGNIYAPLLIVDGLLPLIYDCLLTIKFKKDRLTILRGLKAEINKTILKVKNDK